MPALLLKEPGHIIDTELLSLLPLFPLGILYRRLGNRRAFHVLRANRVRQLDPESDGRWISAAETWTDELRMHRRDSLGSCSSIGGAHWGDTFWPSFTASNSTRFLPDCGEIRVSCGVTRAGGGGKGSTPRHESSGAYPRVQVADSRAAEMLSPPTQGTRLSAYFSGTKLIEKTRCYSSGLVVIDCAWSNFLLYP